MIIQLFDLVGHFFHRKKARSIQPARSPNGINAYQGLVDLINLQWDALVEDYLDKETYNLIFGDLKLTCQVVQLNAGVWPYYAEKNLKYIIIKRAKLNS